MIAIAAAKYPDGLRVRYINPFGKEKFSDGRDCGPITDEPPAWYCAKPTDGSGPKEWYEGIV